MLLYRKDEIVKKAAERNQLPMGKRTPVQFVQDYYNEDWHVKAGTLAYIKVGTVLTTITESNGKEYVECRIIADLAAGKDTIEIPAIAFDDGTLLVKGEKREPCLCSEVFAPPSDGDLQTIRMYEEVNAKTLKDANSSDMKIAIAGGVTALIGLAFIGSGVIYAANVMHANLSDELLFDSLSATLVFIGSMFFVTGFLLPVHNSLTNNSGTGNRRLEKQKKNLEDELLRRDAENVKVYEKGEPNGRSSF